MADGKKEALRRALAELAKLETYGEPGGPSVTLGEPEVVDAASVQEAVRKRQPRPQEFMQVSFGTPKVVSRKAPPLADLGNGVSVPGLRIERPGEVVEVGEVPNSKFDAFEKLAAQPKGKFGTNPDELEEIGGDEVLPPTGGERSYVGDPFASQEEVNYFAKRAERHLRKGRAR